MKKKKTERIPLREQYRQSKGKFIAYFVLRVIVIAALVSALVQGRYENAAICVLTLVLFMLPSLIERSIKIDLPDTLEVILLLFIFAAEILGELRSFYVRVHGWDTMLHTINGFLFAAIGFCLVDLFNRTKSFRFELAPGFLAVMAFCFSMTIGVLWEFFEFAMDYFFLLDMQKDTVIHTFSSVALDPTNSNIPILLENITEVSIDGQDLGLGGYLDIGLYDTMKDLFVNLIGAVVFSIIGFFYVKNRGKGKFATQFIPVVETEQVHDE